MCEVKNYLHHVGNLFCTRTKFFFCAYKKSALFLATSIDNYTKDCKESKLLQKVALCHNEVNTKASFRQKARTDGKVELYRTKTDVSLCKSSFVSAHLLWLIDLAPRPPKGGGHSNNLQFIIACYVAE